MSCRLAVVWCVLAFPGLAAAAEPEVPADGAQAPAPAPKATPAPAGAGGEAEAGQEAEWGASGPYLIDFGATLGFGTRVDDPPLYAIDERSGLLLGALVGLTLSRRVWLGLAYEHLDLGREDSGVTDAGVVVVTRELHAGWLSLRLVPYDVGPLDFHIGLGVALASEQADVDASLWSAVEPGRHVDYQCSAGGSPGFGFRAALGATGHLGAGFFTSLDASVSNVRLDDELIDGCAPGVGTFTVLSLQGALGYRFDP
jgi:hypothetical protein